MFLTIGTAFICLFLDHTQGSHYYWHVGSFKVSHFFIFSITFYFITHFDGHIFDYWHCVPCTKLQLLLLLLLLVFIQIIILNEELKLTS